MKNYTVEMNYKLFFENLKQEIEFLLQYYIRRNEYCTRIEEFKDVEETVNIKNIQM
jgi:hypothetical protein